jgi:hypothetical protein
VIRTVPGPQAVTGQLSPYAGSSLAFALDQAEARQRLLDPVRIVILTDRISVTGPFHSRIAIPVARGGPREAVDRLSDDLRRQILARRLLDLPTAARRKPVSSASSSLPSIFCASFASASADRVEPDHPAPRVLDRQSPAVTPRPRPWRSSRRSRPTA